MESARLSGVDLTRVNHVNQLFRGRGVITMWKTKLFRFRDMQGYEVARARMDAWLGHNRGHIQFEEILVDNAVAVQYRVLLRVY